MNVTDLKVNRVYKLILSNFSSNTSILGDGNTKITLLGSNSTTSIDWPVTNIDYLYWSADNQLLSFDDVQDYGTDLDNITYLFYKITTLDQSECTVLAANSIDYNGTGNFSTFTKILKADYDTIVAAYPNSATISTGATVTYDPDAVYFVDGIDDYVTPEELGEQVTYSVSGTSLTIIKK